LRGTRLFLTGRNEWTSPERLDAVERATLWLSSGGRANTRRGDGRLVAESPGDATPDRFVHNPADPVPWQPHGGSFSRSSSAKLTLDTSFATSRDDVLVYDSEPMTSPVVVVGRALARLWVEGNARDADWVVAIEDAFPGGGRSVHLGHGIVRAGAVADVERGRPYELAIELTPVAHEFLPGHVLRLLVGSSLWPLYAVNYGGGDYLHDVDPLVAEHAVFHQDEFPSRLELPLGATHSETAATRLAARGSTSVAIRFIT
jgi:putative CocE/NonD family hydrolase